MKSRVALCAMLVLLAPFAVSAQEIVGGQEFLTEHEVDLIREAQEPNTRIETYLHFALLRLELIKQKLAVEAPGRSVEIHRNLGEYSKIIEAIDMVVDDALVRETDIAKGMELIGKQEADFLATLKSIEEKPADDHWRYEFVLDDAIDITNDSVELAQGDLEQRKRDVESADAEQHRAIEGTLAPEMREQKEKAKKAAEAQAAEEKRKRPTLLKPGEKKETKP
jgi:hypothetical protein